MYSDFSCPICKSKGYEEIKGSNGIKGPDGRTWVEKCVCKGCTVEFKDPEKFTKASNMKKGRQSRKYYKRLSKHEVEIIVRDKNDVIVNKITARIVPEPKVNKSSRS